MNEFGEALKAARIKARKKLREVADEIGLSIGYISDIEQGRKSPPDLEIVRTLQDFLRVENNELVLLASDERTKRPTEVMHQLQKRPILSQLFMRVKNLSDEKIIEIINNAGEK